MDSIAARFHTLAREGWPLLGRERFALAVLLTLALALRISVALVRTNPVYPDEIFQYLEQGHRLAFGRGVVPWEYDIGIRSWLLPSLIAGVMKLCGSLSSSPLFYVYVLRVIATVLSLSIVVVGFRTVLPRSGRYWAIVAGLFCATWYQALFYAPAWLTEVIAAYLMLIAIPLAEAAADKNKTTSVLLGAILGLAFCIRYQMAPALLVIAIWHARREWKKWLLLSTVACASVLSIAGALDWVTLGRPFQSLWLNFALNAVSGVSAQFGRDPWYAYLADIAPSGHPDLLLVLWFALVGAYRAPLLAITSLTVFLSHSVLAHKEPRFIVFTLLSIPILAALGAATLSQMIGKRSGKSVALLIGAFASLYVPIASFYEWRHGQSDSYLPNTGVLKAFVLAHGQRDLCGLGVADIYWTLTGGYTYFDRNVPLYYSRWLRSTARTDFYAQGTDEPVGAIPLDMHVELRGRPIVQFPDGEFAKNSRAFNYIVAAGARSLPGYAVIRCLPNEERFGSGRVCVLRREGGCSGQH